MAAGTVFGRKDDPMTDLERFTAKVDVPTDPDACWLWTGSVMRHGYGWFYFRSRSDAAHRAAYELFRGPIPAGMHLDHTCHTNDPDCAGGFSCLHRRCVNPAHLEPVSKRENDRRGQSPMAKEARLSHCKHGHPLSGENLRPVPNRPPGWRECEVCYQRRKTEGIAKRSETRRIRRGAA